MKKSIYNIFWELDNKKKLAFNSMSCALAEIDEKFENILKNIEAKDYESVSGDEKELVDKMLEGNYIVQDYIDELKIVKYKHLSGKYKDESLGLTIAPTLSCNFACPYCYENPESGFMSQEVIDGILDMVTNASIRKKNVSITWYGGEPLLAIELIEKVSKEVINICEKNNSKYNSFMVTNGYLINDEVIQKMKNSKIPGVQITIDGPPDIHNSRRKLLKNDQPTFEVILANIKKLIDNDIKPNIRINIDKTNIERIEELLDILIENDLRNLTISLGHVTAYTDACQSISDTCLNTEEYALEDVKYQNMLINKGFNAKSYPYYPGIKANYCCADAISGFVIDPKGFMYKCWNDIGTTKRAVGNVLKLNEVPDENMFMRNVEYISWSPFNFSKCVECNLLPICMGGCPYNGEKNNEPNCEKWKYSLEKVMISTYLKKEREEEKIKSAACGCS